MPEGINYNWLLGRAQGRDLPFIGYSSPVVSTTGAGTGALPGTYSTAYGGIPKAPTIEASQTGAVNANVATLPALQALADQINATRWGTYTGRIPNYGAKSTAESENIDYLLKGGTPTESWATSAARNLGMGVAGSPFGNTIVAQNIESDRIKKAQLGQQMLQNVWGRSTSVPSYDVTQGFVTPQQTYDSALAQAIYGSAPVPAAAADAKMAAAAQGIRLGSYGPYGAAGRPSTSSSSSWLQDIINRYQKSSAPTTTATASPTPTTAMQATTTGDYSPGVRQYGGWNDNAMYGQGEPDLSDPYDQAYSGVSPDAARRAAASYYKPIVPTDSEFDQMASGTGLSGQEMADLYRELARGD